MRRTSITALTSTLLFSITLSGCNFVSLTDAGSQVAQSSADAMVNCALLGEVTSQTKDTVLLERNAGKVQLELIVLARNRAAELEATDLVQISRANRGKATFEAYRCD